MIRSVWLLVLALAALPVAAQDRSETFRLGDDVFVTGGTVAVGGEGIDDAFAAGERVELSAPVGGTAHLAGRRVNAAAAIAGDLYAAGADVTLTAALAGDASLFGYDIQIGAPVGGDLRAFGANIRVDAPVSGTGLLAASRLDLNAVITGDVVVIAEDVGFGPAARIDGRLVLYGDDADEIDVPERVVSADRLERRDVEERLEAQIEGRRPGPLALAGGFLAGVLVLALLGLLAASLAPQNLERMRLLVSDRPLRTVWIGFLALAALFGSAFLLVLTVIGIVIAPAALILAGLAGVLGYVLASYLVGRALWGWFGALPPDTLPERAMTAGLGALAVGLLALVPILGWIAVFVLTLTGIGAFAIAVFRPELRT